MVFGILDAPEVMLYDDAVEIYHRRVPCSLTLGGKRWILYLEDDHSGWRHRDGKRKIKMGSGEDWTEKPSRKLPRNGQKERIENDEFVKGIGADPPVTGGNRPSRIKEIRDHVRDRMRKKRK